MFGHIFYGRLEANILAQLSAAASRHRKFFRCYSKEA